MILWGCRLSYRNTGGPVGCRGMLQAQEAPTPTEHHPNLWPISPARAQPWLPASQPCQPGQVPHRCVLWGQTPLGMSRDPPGLSLLFILTRSCSVVEQLPRSLLRVMMYRGLEMKGNILPLKRRGIVSAVLNSETWMWKRNACGCDEKLPRSSSHVIGLGALSGCEIMELGTEGTHERRDTSAIARAGV